MRGALHFIRHGQTEHNVRRLFTGGNVETPLTAEGRAGSRSISSKTGF